MTSRFSKLLQSFRRLSSQPRGFESPISDDVPLRLGSHPLHRPHHQGCWETCEIEASGLLRLVGWTRDPVAIPDLWVNGVAIPLLNQYRTYRPDVTPHTQLPFSGITFEYQLPYNATLREIQLSVAGDRLWKAQGTLTLTAPAYEGLLSGDTVLGRQQIYGEGMPSPVVSEVVMALVEPLPTPILDFGCGMGALLGALRSRDREAYQDIYGIEIDRPAIRQQLRSDVADYVTLYDGSFPLPYDDGQFAAVVSIEVIEHIPNYRRVLEELARVSREQAVFTVPNSDAIPLCFPQQVVPWHLLEATHVNFFNPSSFQKLLLDYFSEVELLQIHPVSVNGTQFYTSVAAICRK